MGQPEEEEQQQQVAVIGEAASVATLLLQKLNEYLGSSNCGRMNQSVHKELEELKCHIRELIRQFAEEEASWGRCYDNIDDHQSSAGSDQDGLQQQEDYSWKRKAKRIIYDIEDEVDQIMTIQYRNNIVPDGLRCTFANCCSLKKHFTPISICCCSGGVFCSSPKKHLAAIRQLRKKLSEVGRKPGHHHVSAAPPLVDGGNTAHDNNGDNNSAAFSPREKTVADPGGDEDLQDNLVEYDEELYYRFRRAGLDEVQAKRVAAYDIKTLLGMLDRGELPPLHYRTASLEESRLPRFMIPVINICDNKNLDDILKILVAVGVRQDSVEMIVVTGAAGTGKTFLVKKACDIYNKMEGGLSVPHTYKWISYDPSLEMKANLANLYETLYFEECKGTLNSNYALQFMNEEGLISGITSFLQSKGDGFGELVLIADDVSDVQHVWKYLIEPVMPKKFSGILIFITRSVDAVCDYPHKRIHVDPELKQKEALDLLLHRTAFRNQDARPCSKVAEAIVTRDCHGVPLAIATAATQLATLGTQPNAWHTLRGNLVKKRPRPASSANSDNNAANVFMLCYNALCFPLKHILLYCCFFPGAREIPIRKLQRLCVAEGFVADYGNTTAEEAARNYLEQLIECQLIVRSAVPGKPETCRVRDTDAVTKLAALIVEEDEYREFFSHTYTRNCKDHKQHVRRLSITGCSDDIPSSSGDVAFLRSCFVSQMRKKIEALNTKINELLIEGNRLVRVLDFTGAEFIEHLPDQLGDLVHLRYLGLRGTKIKKLPASASRLPNLQSLDIRDTEVTSLPRFMMRYGKFRHLHFAGSFVRKVVELRAVEKELKAPNLQTLAGVRATELLLGYLENWTQLRKLAIGRVKRNNSAKLWASINLMKSLRSLTIKTHGPEKLQLAEIEMSPVISLQTLKIGGRTDSILSQFGNFFPSLTRLYLWDSMLDEDPFECLNSLENLVILCLSNACCRKEMKCCKGWFPKLKKLSIQRMRDLELLEIEEEGMASLEIFFVGYCPKLKPTLEVESETVRYDRNIPKKLKLVQISRMPQEYAIGMTKSNYSIHIVQPDEYQQYLNFEESKKQKEKEIREYRVPVSL